MALSLTFMVFNSIKVRLRQDAPAEKKELNMFQFHKGTIKTGGEVITPRCWV